MEAISINDNYNNIVKSDIIDNDLIVLNKYKNNNNTTICSNNNKKNIYNYDINSTYNNNNNNNNNNNLIKKQKLNLNSSDNNTRNNYIKKRKKTIRQSKSNKSFVSNNIEGELNYYELEKGHQYINKILKKFYLDYKFNNKAIDYDEECLKNNKKVNKLAIAKSIHRKNLKLIKNIQKTPTSCQFKERNNLNTSSNLLTIFSNQEVLKYNNTNNDLILINTTNSSNEDNNLNTNLDVLNNCNKKLIKKISNSLINTNKKRDILKLNNLYDSFSEGEEEYNFFDYVPSKLSINPSSKLADFISNTYELNICLITFFSSLNLILNFNNKSTIFYILNIYFEFVYTFNFIIYFFIGFIDKKTQETNYSIKSKFNFYVNKHSALKVFIDYVYFVYNALFIRIVFYIFNLNEYSYNLLININKIFKSFMILYLFNWVNPNKLLTQLNEINFIAKNKILISLLKFITCFKIFFYYFLLIHIFSCYFIAVYIYNSNNLNYTSWIYSNNLQDVNFINLYLSTFYFCLTTLLSVGYGDITPKSNKEILLCILFMSIGCFFYSFLITLLSFLYSKKETKLSLFLKKYQILCDIQKEYKFNEDLFKKVYHSILNTNNLNDDKITFINSLPKSVKLNLEKYLYNNISHNLYFFKNINNKSYIYEVCKVLKKQIYNEKIYLLTAGNIIEEMFFVAKGSLLINLSEKYNNYPIAKINKHYSFGEYYIETNYSEFSIKTNSHYNEIYSLSKKNYLNIKYKFPNEIKESKLKSKFVHHYIEQLKVGAIIYYDIKNSFNNFRSFIQQLVNSQINHELDNSKNNLIEKTSKNNNNNNNMSLNLDNINTTNNKNRAIKNALNNNEFVKSNLKLNSNKNVVNSNNSKSKKKIKYTKKFEINNILERTSDIKFKYYLRNQKSLKQIIKNKNSENLSKLNRINTLKSISPFNNNVGLSYDIKNNNNININLKKSKTTKFKEDNLLIKSVNNKNKNLINNLYNNNLNNNNINSNEYSKKNKSNINNNKKNNEFCNLIHQNVDKSFTNTNETSIDKIFLNKLDMSDNNLFSFKNSKNKYVEDYTSITYIVLNTINNNNNRNSYSRIKFISKKNIFLKNNNNDNNYNDLNLTTNINKSLSFSNKKLFYINKTSSNYVTNNNINKSNLYKSSNIKEKYNKKSKNKLTQDLNPLIKNVLKLSKNKYYADDDNLNNNPIITTKTTNNLNKNININNNNHIKFINSKNINKVKNIINCNTNVENNNDNVNLLFNNSSIKNYYIKPRKLTKSPIYYKSNKIMSNKQDIINYNENNLYKKIVNNADADTTNNNIDTNILCSISNKVKSLDLNDLNKLNQNYILSSKRSIELVDNIMSNRFPISNYNNINIKKNSNNNNNNHSNRNNINNEYINISFNNFYNNNNNSSISNAKFLNNTDINSISNISKQIINQIKNLKNINQHSKNKSKINNNYKSILKTNKIKLNSKIKNKYKNCKFEKLINDSIKKNTKSSTLKENRISHYFKSNSNFNLFINDNNNNLVDNNQFFTKLEDCMKFQLNILKNKIK